MPPDVAAAGAPTTAGTAPEPPSATPGAGDPAVIPWSGPSDRPPSPSVESIEVWAADWPPWLPARALVSLVGKPRVAESGGRVDVALSGCASSAGRPDESDPGVAGVPAPDVAEAGRVSATTVLRATVLRAAAGVAAVGVVWPAGDEAPPGVVPAAPSALVLAAAPLALSVASGAVDRGAFSRPSPPLGVARDPAVVGSDPATVAAVTVDVAAGRCRATVFAAPPTGARSASAVAAPDRVDGSRLVVPSGSLVPAAVADPNGGNVARPSACLGRSWAPPAVVDMVVVDVVGVVDGVADGPGGGTGARPVVAPTASAPGPPAAASAPGAATAELAVGGVVVVPSPAADDDARVDLPGSSFGPPGPCDRHP